MPTLLLLILLAFGAAVAAADPAPAGPTRRIGAESLAWCDAFLAQPQRSQELVSAAEAIVDRLIGGGHLYVAGDPGFCDEMNGRAGGFAGVKIWVEGPRITDKDVVLIGLTSPNDKGARCPLLAWACSDPGRFHGAAVILLANSDWPQVGRVDEAVAGGRLSATYRRIDTHAFAGGDLAATSINQLATVATALALHGELFAAATRKGKTLTMYTSIFEPGGQEFYDKNKDKNTLDDLTVAPVPPATLGRAFVTTCREQIASAFSDQRAAAARQAGKRLADCQARGGSIWTIAGGHLFLRGLTIPAELPAMSMYGRAWEWTAPQGVRAGDTLFYIGYLEYPKSEVDACVKAGADAVVLSASEGAADEHVTALVTAVQKWDGVVPVPGYPFKMLASSGVVMTPQLYSVMAEAQACLAK
jgi:hypothetical protein